jgi:hypothetical protein
MLGISTLTPGLAVLLLVRLRPVSLVNRHISSPSIVEYALPFAYQGPVNGRITAATKSLDFET